ncbi:MAG: sulfatase-like hydrolase/transferase [Salinivirgaceae bacterium]|jgi:phosphoglycerol transferase MdoB-like AlkP superfamily enzyme|nr:sulfatase-like hydrolase/transferase [Salinivirgaceae bacterium]
MHRYYKNLILTGKRLLLIMVFMTISRLIFYIFNFSFFASLSTRQVLYHFVYGIRFDLAIVFLFNLLFILLSVFPNNFILAKAYQKTLKVLIVFVNSILLGVNFVDTKFYEFEGKRLTADFFSKEWLGEDFRTLLPEFLKDYWYMFILFIAFIYLLGKLYSQNKKNNNMRVGITIVEFIKQLSLTILVVVVSIVAGRGGVQLKPIGVIAAARYTSPEFMPLVLNSPFTIVKTFGDQSLPSPNYFPISIIDSVYNPVHEFSDSGTFKNKNVVIIILESFGREYSGFLNDTIGYTPVLDSIMKQGLTFTNAFANGKRSIEALPSIFSGLPALMDKAFVNTQFTANSIEGIGNILKNVDYETAFYHGGKNGTMGFDNYVKLVGVEKYFGIDEYTNEQDYDGNWGVFDEPYLQYFAKELSGYNEPFFASVFTLSSHHPYKIPEQYEGKFPEGDLINLESIGYADYSLGQFFKTAAKQSWYSNTLFVLTADHTAQSKGEFYKSNVGKYAVPIVLYAPGDTSLVGVSEKICQQTDILPSVLDYLNYNKPFTSFGESLFSNDSSGYAVNYLSGVYQLITKDVVICFDGGQLLNYNFSITDTVSNQILMSSDSIALKLAEDKLKGIIQQYNFRMEHNLMNYKGKLSDYAHK